MTHMDVKGERVNTSIELKEEERKDRKERPHAVYRSRAVRSGMPKA